MVRPWRPLAATSCCTVDGHAVVGGLAGRCRPTRSDFAKGVFEFGRLPLVDGLNGGSSSARFAEELGTGLHAFRLCELRAATHGFSNDYLLGEGGFGTVHKGYVDDKLRPGLRAQPVAVKILDVDGLQGHREWLAEVILLGQQRHPHLVKLIGFCCENEDRLLVYEFMPRGSLENHLFSRMSFCLPWGTRLKIAIGAARGLAFLHGAEKPIIYRDFKASNILLDSDYTAKLSDFGLAKLGPEGKATHVTTRVMGTQGYAAPEYVMTGHLTTKSDVYSFGVVLLELLTGRRSVDKARPKGEEKLVDWARPHLSSTRKLWRIMDPRLAGHYSIRGAKTAALLALRCTSPIPKDRPRMGAVVEALEALQNLRDLAISCQVWTSATPVAGKSVLAARSRMEVRRAGVRRPATTAFSGRLR